MPIVRTVQKHCPTCMAKQQQVMVALLETVPFVLSMQNADPYTEKQDDSEDLLDGRGQTPEIVVVTCHCSGEDPSRDPPESVTTGFWPQRIKRFKQRSKQKRRTTNLDALPLRKSSQSSYHDSTDSDSSGSKVPATIPNSALLEHVATSRFFHHYVSPSRTAYRLNLDFTSWVIDHATTRNILAEVIIALGILTLPQQNSASLLAARCRYTRAIRLTNEAIADTKLVKTDGVLMAVILLGLYEVSEPAQCLHAHA